MRIGNLNINTDMKTILDKLISQLHENGSLLFSKKYKDSGDYLIVQCPYHKMGQEKHPSAQFRKSDGLFYCHGCKESHSLPAVIEHCLETSGRGWLLDNFDGSSIEQREISFNLPKLNTKNKQTNFVDKSVLKKYRFTHPYMFKRKLTLDIIRKFDVGYDKDYILITEKDGKVIKRDIGECITFPVKDEDGNIVFIARRAINTKFFHYPQDVDKPIYGLYEIYREQHKGIEINDVYICESMINCLTLWSWGKYAIALNGTGSTKQHEMLKKCNIRHFILALDPDDAGNMGTEKLIKALSYYKMLDVLSIPKGKDINDLTYEEFCKLELKKPNGLLF